MAPVAVIAIGGNSIIRPGEDGSISQQWDAADETCKHIAQIIKQGYTVVITHGNGPQVGNILLRSELSKNELPTLPLDVCGADSQGAMGYMLQQLLDKELKKIGLKKQVLTLVSQVVVDKGDQAFENPAKPIGPFYSKEEADKHRLVDHWDLVEDAGRGYRRVVASPLPIAIVEEDAIKQLVSDGYILIAMGGGGIPVIQHNDNTYSGVAAVVDKDRASSLLAGKLKADMFVISTAVEKVCINFGTPEQEEVDRMTIAEAKQYIKEGHFKPGSMLPKIEAVIDFLENGGKEALITVPEKLEEALQGKTGTRVVP